MRLYILRLRSGPVAGLNEYPGKDLNNRICSGIKKDEMSKVPKKLKGMIQTGAKQLLSQNMVLP